MISAKHVMVCTVVLLSVLTITAVKGNAAPVETSHWNSNTFGNLNTLADTTTVTFSIEYNETGTIEWFKDGVLADTLSGATSVQFTTAWPATGMKEVKVRMTNGGGTSAETVWPVEVQNTGDAAVAEHTGYPDERVYGHYTIYITTGWVNLPTLYLKIKKPDDWLEYISSGTYLLRANVIIGPGATMRMNDASAKVLFIRALPQVNRQEGRIDIAYGATCAIDSMTVVGWDIDADTEATNDTSSPDIVAMSDCILNVTNSVFRHIYVKCGGSTHYPVSSTRHVCTISSNTFLEGKPYQLYIDVPDAVVSNNYFYGGESSNALVLGERSLIENNKVIGKQSATWGSDLLVGEHCRVIGNELTLAGWNDVEVGSNVFLKNNTIHDTSGLHNGFNNVFRNVYSYNDYCYNLRNYAGWYSQFYDDGHTYPPPLDWYPDHVYIVNGRSKDSSTGFNFFGGFDMYVYNFTCDHSCGNVQYGSDRIFVRKSAFQDTKLDSDFSLRVVDYDPDNYGYAGTVTALDCVFSGVNAADYLLYAAGNAMINSINSCRKDTEGRLSLPTVSIHAERLRDWAHPETRYYVWLDTLVKDHNGSFIKDANVTVECLTDPAAPTLKVTLPPPPPDLSDVPAENLPQPKLESFARLKTLSSGKLPGPNYGWSANAEPCVALLVKKLGIDRTAGNIAIGETAGYQYRITARYHGLEASQTVTPDAAWLAEDPTIPAHTVELVLNGDAAAGTDTTSPVLTITSPQDNKPVTGIVAIAVTASDNWDIDHIEIFVDNISRAVITADSCTWSADSYSCSWNWNTAQERDGSHSIKVVARDISGNLTEKTVTVEVLTETVGSSADEAVVYPNPYIKGKSRGSTCTFANLAPDATVRIYGISGDLVTTLTTEMSGDRAGAEWDVSKIGGGVYLYTVHSSKGVQKGKIGIVK